LFIFVFSKNELEIFGLKYFDGKKCVNYFAFIIICFSASVALVKNLFEYPFKKEVFVVCKICYYTILTKKKYELRAN